MTSQLKNQLKNQLKDKCELCSDAPATHLSQHDNMYLCNECDQAIPHHERYCLLYFGGPCDCGAQQRAIYHRKEQQGFLTTSNVS